MDNYRKIVELYKLMNEQEELRKVFYANDYPVPYKTLTLFPVQVDLYYYFHLLVECLLLPHKTSGDIKAISMSYLKYVCYLATQKGELQHVMFLGELLLIVLRKEKKYLDKNGAEHPTIDINLDKGCILVEGKEFTDKDFDEIRKIILEQNAIEIPDESINPEIIKTIQEIEAYKLKQSKKKMCSFEDQINIVVAKSSYRRDEIMKMTIRSFSRLLERIDKVMDYEIKSVLVPYMDDKGKEAITHYAEDTDKTTREKYESMLTDIDKLKENVSG